MSPETLKACCENLPDSLRALNISGCRLSLSNLLVKEIYVNASQLKELDMSDATQISGDCIEYIPAMLTSLENLSVSRCYNIAPISYLELSKSESLRFLNVFGVLKDAALAELRLQLSSQIVINRYKFTSIARPTVGIKRTSIWLERVRE